LGEDEGSRKAVLQKFKNELVGVVGFNYDIRESLTNIGNFVIVKVNKSDLASIQKLDTVKNIERNKLYQANSISNSDPVVSINETGKTNYSRLDLKADAGVNQGKGTLIAVLDNYFQLDHECFSDLSVSDVKYTKTQMETMIANTTLTAQGTTYYNNKIPFYYDYAQKDNTMIPNSPSADNTHGIHVASIAAANGTYTGIAPNAQVALCKISSDTNTGSASDETILRALNDVVALGADVINLSFGSPLEEYDTTDFEEAEIPSVYRVAKTLSENGVIFSVSAGNEGKGAFIKDKAQTNDYGDYCNNSLDWVENGIVGGYVNSRYASIVASGRLSAEYDGTVKDASLYTQKVSGFSSEGATFDLGIGPDIIVPGEQIYGGVFYKNTDTEAKRYDFKNGTSMAAPNFSGVVANVLSDADISTPEKRKDYQVSLSSRLQSTADPIVQYNGAYYSPRKQGAGQANISKAIKSDVYLKGDNNKAEIELKNNADVAKGNIKFTVKSTNESVNEKKYSARLVVETPAFAKENTEASLFNQLLGEKTFDVTLPAGEGSFDVDYSIDSLAKETLAKFPNGNYLEGYVVLTPVDSNDVTLSIPYMGFYGDFSKAEPVEKFDFEKKDGEITGSNILNSAYQTKLQKVNADFSSTIVTSNDSISTKFKSVVAGETNLYKLGTKIIQEDGQLIGGIKNLSNYINILQVVYRNIANNEVSLINDKGEKVYGGKLANLCENEEYKSENGTLLKSMVMTDEQTIVSCKAVGEIKLIETDGSLVYPVGNYTLRFDYYLLNGSLISKDYSLKIKGGEAIAPQIGVKTFDESSSNVKIALPNDTTNVTLNGDIYDVKENDGNKYVEFDKSTYASKGKVLLVVTNEYGLSVSQLFNLSDLATTGFSVESSLLKSTYTATLESETSEIGEDKKFTVHYQTIIKNARGNQVSDILSYVVNVNLPSNANVTGDEFNPLSSLVVVKETGYDGAVKVLPYTIHDGVLSYTTSSGNVSVTYVEAEIVPETPSGIAANMPLIIGLTIGGVLVVLATVVIIVVINKKKVKKNVK